VPIGSINFSVQLARPLAVDEFDPWADGVAAWANPEEPNSSVAPQIREAPRKRAKSERRIVSGRIIAA
jgi:hypothetical protein